MIEKITTTFLFLFYITTSVFSQSGYLIKNKANPVLSHIYEFGNGNLSKIGIGTVTPQAKLHVLWNAKNDTSIVRFETTTMFGRFVGSLESWRFEGGVYYGIYQSQADTIIVPKNYLKNNLGLDVLNPSYKLDINGIIGCSGNKATGFHISNTNQPFVFQYYSSNGGGLPDELSDGESEPIEGADITLSPLTLYSWGAKVQNYLECTSVLTTYSLKIRNTPHVGSLFICNDLVGNGSWTDPSVFSITSGNVRIGTANEYPDYKLAVNGKILCTEMKVKLYEQWPDYVFKPDYKLRTLQEVDQYIQINKHLPELPSAKEVTETGINVGEMNAKLVKKVEELTLYIIALQKEMDQLKTKVSSR